MTPRPPGRPRGPRGLCPVDEARFWQDDDLIDLEHEACRVAAQQHLDQLEAYAMDPRRGP